MVLEIIVGLIRPQNLPHHACRGSMRVEGLKDKMEDQDGVATYLRPTRHFGVPMDGNGSIQDRIPFDVLESLRAREGVERV